MLCQRKVTQTKAKADRMNNANPLLMKNVIGGAGAIYCTQDSKLTVMMTTIRKHSSRHGAAVALNGGCSAEFTDCELHDNLVDHHTSSVSLIPRGAGAVLVIQGQLILRSCKLLRNAAVLWCNDPSDPKGARVICPSTSDDLAADIQVIGGRLHMFNTSFDKLGKNAWGFLTQKNEHLVADGMLSVPVSPSNRYDPLYPPPPKSRFSRILPGTAAALRIPSLQLFFQIDQVR